MAASNNLREELDKIALAITKDIQMAECPLDIRLDAFKVLSSYHLGLMKKGDKTTEPDDGRPKFNDLRKRIAAVE